MDDRVALLRRGDSMKSMTVSGTIGGGEKNPVVGGSAYGTISPMADGFLVGAGKTEMYGKSPSVQQLKKKKEELEMYISQLHESQAALAKSVYSVEQSDIPDDDYAENSIGLLRVRVRNLSRLVFFLSVQCSAYMRGTIGNKEDPFEEEIRNMNLNQKAINDDLNHGLHTQETINDDLAKEVTLLKQRLITAERKQEMLEKENEELEKKIPVPTFDILNFLPAAVPSSSAQSPKSTERRRPSNADDATGGNIALPPVSTVLRGTKSAIKGKVGTS